MSDLSGFSHVNHGAADFDGLASPRKRVAELREEWSRVGLSTGQGGRNGETLLDIQDGRDVLPVSLAALLPLLASLEVRTDHDYFQEDPRDWTSKGTDRKARLLVLNYLLFRIAAHLVIFVHSCLTRYPPHAEASKKTPEWGDEGVHDGVWRTSQRHDIGLHPTLVRDIESWIRQNGIDGKAFISESDKDWG